MAWLIRALALACGVATAGFAWADAIFYEHDDFRGRSFTVVDPVDDFARFGFNDRASSVVVRKGSYQLCEHANYRGRCVTLKPGSYGSLRSLGFNDRISSARPASRTSPRAVLYSQPNFGGSRVVLEGHNAVRDFSQSGFNDRASSLRVDRGQWLHSSH